MDTVGGGTRDAYMAFIFALEFFKVQSHCSDIETKVQGSKWKVSEKFAWLSGSSDRQLLQFLEIITKT